MRSGKNYDCCAVMFRVAVALSVCLGLAGTATAVQETSTCRCLKKVVSKLYNPVEYVTIRRDHSLLTLVVEQRGVVRSFSQDNQERRPAFMNITDRVTTSDAIGEERGLLSMVLHPNYTLAARGKVYVYYITSDSGQDYAVISEFEASDDVVDVASERQLLRMEQLAVRGNGGQLLFGDDGFLYIFTGDGTGHDDTAGHAQDMTSLLGKALRVDVNNREQGSSSSAYVVPPSNPFYQGAPVGARPEIYALGFRNPWRCSQDRASRGGTGAIFCGDTGTDLFEEVNIVKAGRNYGWNLKEGDYCFNAINCSKIENEEGPVYSYPHTPGSGSAVVGGFVYHGSAFPSVLERYVYGDAVSGQVFTLHEDKISDVSSNWTSKPWPVCPLTMCPCQARDLGSAHLLAFGLNPTGEVMLMMSEEFSVLRPQGTLYQVYAPTGTDQEAVTCGTCSLTPTAMLTLLSALIITTRN